MPRLSTFRIAGWESIREIDPPLELGPLNVLIGANGSGNPTSCRSFRCSMTSSLNRGLNPHNIPLNWRKRGGDSLFGPHQLSDGSLRAMALITLFLQPPEDLPAPIVVDEPELGLHPHAIEMIAGLIQAASLTTQVILTTQSTTFREHLEPEEIIVVDDEQRQSIFRHLDQERLQHWLQDYGVGQRWEKNVPGGGPLASRDASSSAKDRPSTVVATESWTRTCSPLTVADSTQS